MDGYKKFLWNIKQVWYILDEALEKNKSMLEKEGKRAWNQREYKTLLLIKDYCNSQSVTT